VEINDAEICKYKIRLAYKLTPKLGGLLFQLYALAIVPIEEVDPVHMRRLRKEMKPRGIVICTKRHLGYWLPNVAVEMVRKAIEATQ
jgi:hypothetical protein